jgi:hypothetical protein
MGDPTCATRSADDDVAPSGEEQPPAPAPAAPTATASAAATLRQAATDAPCNDPSIDLGA